MLDLKPISGYIDDIRNAKENNTLAIFVGAGITRKSERNGIKIPLWSDLAHSLKKELDDYNEEDFLKIAELYYLKYGNAHYVSKVRDLIPLDIQPSEIHKLILKLNPQVIITTNWDNLLEKAIEKYGYFYDVIACDKDLGISYLSKKLIKMHGDFTHHNFVFKESDYINYGENFPLIENYVKSILSSSTVLFLGYSFNDYNLKQILAWINKRTTSTPNLYIIQDRDNRWERKYLESHKLIPINIAKDELEHFLNAIDARISYDCNSIEKYILSKLQHLEPLNNIYYRDIELAFGNQCIVNNYKNVNLINFEGLKSELQDGTILYENFVKKLEDLNNQKQKEEHFNIQLERIFNILLKADIGGIYKYQSEGKVYYYPTGISKENTWIKNYLEFDFLRKNNNTNEKSEQLKSAIVAYNLHDYKSAYIITRNVIDLCLSEKDFLWAFIAMINNRNLAFFIENDSKCGDLQVGKFDLEEKFSNLSTEWRNKVKSIYNLSNFSLYYKVIAKILHAFFQKENAVRYIKKRGSHWENYPDSYRFWHKSLLDFVIGNFLIVENYQEFILSIELFLRTTIIRSEITKKICLNKYEIFSAIKYFDNRKVASLFEACFIKKGRRNYRKLEFEDDIDKDWLKRVLSTLSQTYTNCSSFDAKRVIERYFQNTLFFLSLIDLSDDDTAAIHKSIIYVVKNNNVTIAMINSIVSFIINRYNLYKSIYPDDMMLDILTIFLKKFSLGNYNREESLALENNNFYIIFNLLQNERFSKFEDIKLLEDVIKKFNALDSNQSYNKSRLVIWLFFPLYSISSEEVKRKLKKFIKSYRANNEYYQIKIKLDSIILFNLFEDKEAPSSILEKEILTLIDNTRDLMKSGKCSLLFDIGNSFRQFRDFAKDKSIKVELSRKIDNLITDIKEHLKDLKFPSQI